MTAAYPALRRSSGGGLAGPDDFGVKGAWLNSAYWHPMLRESAAAVQDYLHFRMADAMSQLSDTGDIQNFVKAEFAQLVNCQPQDLAFVPSTTVGENLVLAGLGIRDGGRVVTDQLHYNGSLYMYEMLRQRGVDVEVISPRGLSIDPDDMRRALRTPTDLVAVSFVSAYNGFAHDLKALSALAHEAGALLYADIIQAAGAVPLDVKAAGVDFCSTASYKWLMGDFGLGFLYAEPRALQKIRPGQFGARQLVDPNYCSMAGTRDNWKMRDGAAGRFEAGTIAFAALMALSKSLPYIRKLGVDAIAEHRLQLLSRLRARLVDLGVTILSPGFDTSSILTFAWPDPEGLSATLATANIQVSIYEDRVRVSPSVFNGPDDIDGLVEALQSSRRSARA